MNLANSEKTAMGKIFIFLPVHNRREITRRFIDCLKSQTYSDYHLILIDDGSSDGTSDMVCELIPTTTILQGKGDWWWAGSLQQGYKWLKSRRSALIDVLLIINDDTEFEADFLETGMSLLSDKVKTLLLAQCYDKDTGQLIDPGRHVDWQNLTFNPAASQEEINCLSTRGLFLRVSDFLQLGGFYPRLLPHYLSDYEFTIRASNKGMRLMSDPVLKLWLDRETTGYHSTGNEQFTVIVKRIFSHKSAINPFAWTAFILLVCPQQWKRTNCIAIWKNTVHLLAASFMKTIKVTGSR